MAKAKSFWKILLKVIAIILAFLILVVGTYFAYVCIQYNRIEDNQKIDVVGNKESVVRLDTEYSITTYNIGFGAYSQDFSFFMDSGETLDGQKLQGTGSVAKSKDTVIFNTNGAIDTIKSVNPDFAFFQEVDVKADRSHKVNQYQEIQKNFEDYSSSISINFHSAYLFYPLTSPHGKTDAGITTLSKYNITSATRRSLPVDESFPTKFFDLDRCFQVTRLPIQESSKELVLINIHLSAYDEGGKVRARQLEMLNGVLNEEKQLGNYVIVGGDFNHDIAGSIGTWETNRKQPEWVFVLNSDNLADGFRFVSSKNAPTCRSTDTAYIKGESYTVVLDGFICSDNITDINISNIDTDFMYSDHNPAKMTFKLV
ncbi:MAG TPA: endonuclease [Clostridiales bacterium]|nr:endonuclease [Clostridiales bacterium]